MRNKDLSRIDLNLLIVFAAVADTGSVTRAAAELSLSQPAVSHGLGRLRRLLDDPLFVRTRHGLAMTPRAEALIEPVSGILDAVSEALLPKGHGSICDRRRRVSADDYAASVVGPQLLRRLHAIAPATRLDLESASVVGFDRLETGELDLALAMASPPSRPFRHLELARDRFVGAIAAGHPLAAKAVDGGVTLDDYLAFPHVQLGSAHREGCAVDRALETIGRERGFVATAPLCAGGTAPLDAELISTMPARMAVAMTAQHLFVFELPFAVEARALLMIWHERTETDAAQAHLRGVVEECSPHMQS